MNLYHHYKSLYDKQKFPQNQKTNWGMIYNTKDLNKEG